MCVCVCVCVCVYGWSSFMSPPPLSLSLTLPSILPFPPLLRTRTRARTHTLTLFSSLACSHATPRPLSLPLSVEPTWWSIVLNTVNSLHTHTQAQCYAYPSVRPKHQAGAQGGKGPAGARRKEGSGNVVEEAKVAECLTVSDSRPSTVADELYG